MTIHEHGGGGAAQLYAFWSNDVKLAPFPVQAAMLLAALAGCNLCPAKLERERVHNPFPQIHRVAVLPFFNQSSEPTVDTDLVAEKYYAALQAVPGFEVLPVGVSKSQWLAYATDYGEPSNGEQFQDFARYLGVDAIVVGSVTDFDAYYPPSMAMTVHWYAANEGFHPIPAGYGLPWGTEGEEGIPRRVALDAEFELAQSQLATQTPKVATADIRSNEGPPQPGEFHDGDEDITQAAGIRDLHATQVTLANESFSIGSVESYDGPNEMGYGPEMAYVPDETLEAPLPPDWPDPTDLIPDPPSPVRPFATISHDPILSHTRIYRGDDPDFTIRLANFVETGDDARPGSWQGYLKRSDDFIHFCCHLHIMEMLESRGGRDQSDLILRWPLSRY